MLPHECRGHGTPLSEGLRTSARTSEHTVFTARTSAFRLLL